jgi:hypothetical protein
MAFLPLYDDEQENPRAQFGQPQLAMGQAAPAQGGAAPMTQASSGGDKGQGKFVNFERYLNANKSAAQATGAGLGADAEKGAKANQSALANAQSEFSAGVKSGSPFGGPQVKSQPFGSGRPGMAAPSGGNGLQQAPQMSTAAEYAVPQVDAPDVGSAGTPQYGVAQQGMSGQTQIPDSSGGYHISAEEAKRLGGQRYSGPSELGGLDSLRSGASAAQDNLDHLGTLSGQEALLRDKYGKTGGYSHGQSRLDAGLTNATSGSDFQRLRGKYGDLAKVIEGANSSAVSQANQARDYNDSIADRYAVAAGDAEAKAKAKADARNQGITNNRNSAAGQKMLSGLSAGERAQLEKLWKSGIASGGPTDVQLSGAELANHEAKARQYFDGLYGAGAYDAAKAAFTSKGGY